jgi:hypothetical protein
MNEHCAERLVSPTRSDVADTADAPIGASKTRMPREPRRLKPVLFLGTVVLAQLSWLGALAYAAFRLL